ncbi:MAG: VOC family protein [Ilumatobacter sp.]
MTHPRIENIELPATDMVMTKAFYSAAFGWEWTDYGPTYSAAMSGDLEIGLTSAAKVAASAAEGDQGSVGPLVLFKTDDLDVALGAVVEGGGNVVTEPFGFPGGRRFHFRDPSGNVLGVYVYDAA